MKKIKCIIMDWAGTAVDYGCFAPVAAFIVILRHIGNDDICRFYQAVEIVPDWLVSSCFSHSSPSV